MNLGVFLGFTRVRGIPSGESFPQLKVRYIHDTYYTLEAGDVDYFLITLAATPVSIYLPSSLYLKDGSAIHFAQFGAGQITLVPEAWINVRCAGQLKTRAQHSVVSLLKADPDNNLNQWYFFGDFAL